MNNVITRSQSTLPFAEAVESLTKAIDCKEGIVRITLFAPRQSDTAAALRAATCAVSDRFGTSAPPVAVVWQAPLPLGSTVMEVESCSSGVRYGEVNGDRYALCVQGDVRRLYTAGFAPHDLSVSVDRGASELFERVDAVLRAAQMCAPDIVRQWNYIEDIVGYEGSAQRYQLFNDARSRYYALFEWNDGYPAATGIGADAGVVCVVIDAATGCRTVAIDNPEQLAAHRYSQQVLKSSGAVRATTPKFERAKAVITPSDTFIYISGTAAINGEQSCAGEAERQSAATVDNIVRLTAPDNLRRSGADCADNAAVSYIRIYVTEPAWAVAAVEQASRLCHGVEPLVTVADICRPELMVEMEGLMQCPPR